MQVRLLNINKMIREKSILEVTSHSVGGPGSLFDPNIFGYGDQTVSRFGYIKLNGPAVHPLLYNISSRLWRELPSIISGSKKFIIDDSGDLIPDEENGSTGINWLYNNFDKINLKKLKTDDKSNVKLTTKKLKLAYDKLTRDEFFIDKILVKPLHFRDLDTDSDTIRMDELNQHYIDLLKACNFRARVTFESYWNDVKIQGILNNIYDLLKRSGTSDKKSVLKSAVMGRTVDNAVRLIIVAPEVRNKDVIGEAKVGLGKITIPLHHFLNGAPTHAVTATRRVLQTFFDYGKMPDMDQTDFDNFFTDDYIKECMINYDHSQLERGKPVKGKYGQEISLYFDYFDDKTGEVIKETRALTWIDLFFLAVQLYKDNLRAVDTRYPVSDKDSNIYCKMIPSTFSEDYGAVKIYLSKDDSDPIYTFDDDYPNVSKLNKNPHLVDSIFEETKRISNLTLGKLGADFDGDKMSTKMVYSKEAREAVDKINKSPLGYLNIDGTSSRSIGKEGIQCLYSLTLSRTGPTPARRNKECEDELNKFVEDKNGRYVVRDILKILDKYNIDEVVQYKGKFTTLGRVIFNEVIFGHLKSYEFYNENMNKGKLEKMIDTYANKLVTGDIEIDDYISLLNKYEQLAFSITDLVSPSLSYDMLIKDDKEFNKVKEQVWDKYKKQVVENNDVAAMANYEAEMIEESKRLYATNPMIDHYNSGAAPKWGVDWKSLKISLGAIPDPGTGKVNIVQSNLKEGMSNEDIIHVANLQIHGAFARAQDTALGGYTVSRLIALFQSSVASKGDCGTKKYLSVVDTNPRDLLYRYVKDGNEEVLVTKDNINKYLNKPIQKRSPAFCKGVNGGHICSKCAGEMMFNLIQDDKVNIGLFVPVIGANIRDAYMKATHDMGAKLYKINDLDEFIE